MRRAFLAQAWRDVEADVWVSYCPELDLYSQGETEGEALEAVIEAAHLHVKHVGARRAHS
jgi:predicted RNase H-like HicB family nuclease